MSTDRPTGYEDDTGVARAYRRAELLEKIWIAEAEGVLAALASKDPSASALQAARAFLRDNDVSLSTLPKLRDRLGTGGFHPGPLPKFNNEDDEDFVGTPNPALKHVGPFAPLTSTKQNDDTD